MWRQLLIISLLFVVFTGIIGITPVTETADESNFYFPVIQKSPPQIEIVVTDIKNEDDYVGFGYNHIYGYVSSQISAPYYSVILGVEVDSWTSDCNPNNPDFPCFFTLIYHITPALPATLPNQINPYADENLCYKACANYDSSVHVISASLTDPNGYIYYPLTVVKWKYTPETDYNGILSGTIRNDNSHTLQNLHLVVAELEKCQWQEAEIADTKLKPNRQTTFRVWLRNSCLGDNLVIVGQGAAER